MMSREPSQTGCTISKDNQYCFQVFDCSELSLWLCAIVEAHCIQVSAVFWISRGERYIGAGGIGATFYQRASSQDNRIGKLPPACNTGHGSSGWRWSCGPPKKLTGEVSQTTHPAILVNPLSAWLASSPAPHYCPQPIWGYTDIRASVSEISKHVLMERKDICVAGSFTFRCAGGAHILMTSMQEGIT